jgi:hypothetical protein
MAQHETSGQARAGERAADEEFLKDNIRRRVEEARDSIEEAVSEVKEAAAETYQSVKGAVTDFDWRDEVKKRPVAWSLGALGVGLLAGYGIATAAKNARREPKRRYVPSEPHAYAAQAIIGESHPAKAEEPKPSPGGAEAERKSEPGVSKESAAPDRLRQELTSLRDRFVDELSSIAHQVLLPALVRKIREAITTNASAKRTAGNQPRVPSSGRTTSAGSGSSTYQPVLERNES